MHGCIGWTPGACAASCCMLTAAATVAGLPERSRSSRARTTPLRSSRRTGVWGSGSTPCGCMGGCMDEAYMGRGSMLLGCKRMCGRREGGRGMLVFVFLLAIGGSAL
eukprot:359927-Chlamydomonas_euryale.AAC.8